jgi:hypothetical protein
MRRDRPGYQPRKNRDGTTAHYWNPQRAVTGAPKTLKMVRLPDGLSDEEVAAACQEWTEDLRKTLIGKEIMPAFDGSIKALVDRFMWDQTSSLHRVKHSTRIRDYEPSLRVLVKNVGNRQISKLRASDFRRWFEKWRESGHRRASGAVKMLRAVLTYGAGERLPGCADARAILSSMRFEQPAQRRAMMTYEQCRAIVEKSAEMGCPSLGFVQAMQFETGLRRIDIIGEWLPAEDGPFRWRGLTVGQIGKDMILRLETSKTGAQVERDLTVLPLVMLALESYPLPEIGPVVIDERYGKPYWENRYTELWREVRDAAGVSDTIWSMDSRAGAVTETHEATGSLADAQQLATHSSEKMTRRYARGSGLEQARRVADARTKKREK